MSEDKVAEVERLRGAHRDLTRRLGFGDNIAEPMADNDTIVRWVDEQVRDADEWRESQQWRIECEVVKGHDPLNDCYECNPALRLDAAETALRAVAALATYRVDIDGGLLCAQCEDYVEDCDSGRDGHDCDMAKIRAVLARVSGAVAKTDDREPSSDEVNAMARVLIDEWERVERKPVGVSYIATFADMARAALAARADALTEGNGS